MRVIAGMAKGRRLKAPPGLDTRPMTDRVREAVFSSLAAELPGADVLDLYAGTGSLGLEALSRGSSSAVFVERDHRALRALRANVETVGLGGRVVASGVDRFVVAQRRRDRPPRFDLVFVDPPYRVSPAAVGATLRGLAPLIRTGGTVVLHRRAGEPGPEAPGFRPVAKHTYGTAGIRRYRRVRPLGRDGANDRLD